MIIDTHQHLGRSMFTGVETTEADLLDAMDENGVDVALVIPQPTLEDIPQCHDRIANSTAFVLLVIGVIAALVYTTFLMG